MGARQYGASARDQLPRLVERRVEHTFVQAETSQDRPTSGNQAMRLSGSYYVTELAP